MKGRWEYFIGLLEGVKKTNKPEKQTVIDSSFYCKSIVKLKILSY